VTVSLICSRFAVGVGLQLCHLMCSMYAIGTEAGLRLCLAEVVSIILTGLSSSSWTIKAQAAATAHSVADKLGSQLGPPHLAVLLTSLVTALPGRTWTGKVMCIIYDVQVK